MRDKNGRARPTIQDVARVAGVSTATASRVLAHSAPVSDRLQQAVLSAAESVGYRVNLAARTLRRDRSSMVGMLVPDLRNPFFTLLIDGIEQRLQPLGMSLLICSSHDDVELETRRIESLVSSRVDVLIVTPADASRSSSSLLAVSGEVPLIQVDQFADGVDADWVGTNEHHGMRLLLSHLADQGVSTAAFVGRIPADSSSRARTETVHKLCADHGIALIADDDLLGTYSAEWGAIAMKRLLVAGPLPDAIICGADVIALGVLKALDEAGLAAPDDILVTGFDDIGLSGHPRLSITTVRQPIDGIAQKTVDLVVDIIGDNSHVRSTYALKPELIVRSSTSRARK